MKREIKFRVWDKEENKFFEPIYEAYKGHLLDLSISLSGQFLRRTLSLPAEHESCFPDKYELNQFTGLKDKNGKEIYEGDIVKTQLGNLKIEWEIYDNQQGYSIDTDDWNLEVIGNIYEHKNLLE